ncbi:MAG: tetratricopeptide repeat protein [Alphaproteobacteria bacterium]|nr:tetratricopeptide repeat protein [Alphaproteobacteria bacterium]
MLDVPFNDVILWSLLALMSAAASYYILRPVLKNKLIDKPNGSLVFIVVASFLPGLALMLYLMLGSPGYSDLPLADRLDVPPETLPLEGLVVHLEQRLKNKPDDSEGWLMLAQTRMALGEADRAEDALLNAISLQDGEQNSDILVMLSESRLQQQDGLIDDGVERLINRALEINPNHPRGLYLRGLSLLQQGDKTEALAIWNDLHSSAEPDSPWQIFLRVQLSLHQ